MLWDSVELQYHKSHKLAKQHPKENYLHLTAHKCILMQDFPPNWRFLMQSIMHYSIFRQLDLNVNISSSSL